MRLAVKALVVIIFSAFLWGCSSVQRTTPSAVYVETGKASFYANLHQSKKTASGEIYDHKLNTAAHKNYPLVQTSGLPI